MSPARIITISLRPAEFKAARETCLKGRRQKLIL